MKQVFLKASYNLGWASADYRVNLGGQGNTGFAETFGASFAKIVIPVAGTLSNLMVYSPVGAHPSYTATVMINGVASTLTCALISTESEASDRTHSVSVVAGDDLYVQVNVSPFGSGSGYPMNLSIEFEGASQFYGVTPTTGSRSTVDYDTGGALGNGNLQTLSLPTSLSNTYSICTIAGTITGIRMKTYSTNVGGGWTGYLAKNQVLQDGSGGTVNTACTLTDGSAQATSTFSLSVAVGDRLDFALARTGTSASSQPANVAMSCIFTPTDAESFMCCGGNNDANPSGATATDYKWVQSEQLQTDQNIAKCPVGPRGIIVKGLLIEGISPPDSAIPGVQSRIFTILKDGVETAATVTVSESATSGSISGLEIPFADGDFIVLKAVNVNTPTVGNGLKWGLLLTTYRDRSGLYFLNLEKSERHDSYYEDVEQKIPDPTIKTALIGE